MNRDDLQPPVRNSELALFTCALQGIDTRRALERIGRVVPHRFTIVHNTGRDDPPDVEAFGFGWECTEFPPNQSALEAVYRERGFKAMTLPPFSQTGRKTKDIHNRIGRENVEPPFFNPADEISVLEGVFLSDVIGGPKSKDVPGNDVLLLDERRNHWADAIAETAVRNAVAKRPPSHIRLILLVGFRPQEVGDRAPVPRVVQVFPNAPV